MIYICNLLSLLFTMAATVLTMCGAILGRLSLQSPAFTTLCGNLRQTKVSLLLPLSSIVALSPTLFLSSHRSQTQTNIFNNHGYS